MPVLQIVNYLVIIMFMMDPVGPMVQRNTLLLLVKPQVSSLCFAMPCDNINYELTRINEWLALNKLNLNINKTKYIIFHFPQRNMAFLDLELKLCGQHIECVRQFVFLGITIHETLNWDRYIDKIANKISRTLGVMNKLKHFLPKYTLKIMTVGLQLTNCTTF